ncbi:DUF3829 domain-containing protein [Stenotrophomonas maltophilia]|uniref:DUF3829 domain-containing protein n=1 Tax=Stenotrophomonas maltophilia TaxID=40324 RepID=UPI003BF860AD
MNHSAACRRLLVFPVLCLLLSACTDAGVGSGSGSGLRERKASAYAKCRNAMELSVRGGFERYTSWMKDADAGPTGTETAPRGPGWSANDVEYDCGNAVTEALERQPPVTFDAAARQYHQALLALQAVAEPVDRYYRREEFRRDGGAGMRRQHAALMQAYARYFAANEVLDAALHQHDLAYRAELLARTEGYQGRSTDYYALRFVGEGRDLVRSLRGPTPDLVAARNQLQQYQTMLQQAQSSGIGKNVAAWRLFELSADTLVSEAWHRVERLEKGQPIVEQEPAVLLPGMRPRVYASPGALSRLNDAYGDLAAASGRLP